VVQSPYHHPVVESVARELVDRLRAALQARSEVLEAYLFGSFARNDATAHSDVDVALYVAEEAINYPGYGFAATISADLQVVLGRSDVDVVLLNRAPPLLYNRVLRDGIRIMSRDLSATTSREGMALSRYCDYVPQLEMIDRVHRERIAQGRFGK
jgi:uncharacterized protein